MQTKAISASLAMLGLAPLASAAVGGTLEFEDLVAGTSYNNGASFVTEGIQVDVKDFFFYPSGDTFSGGSADVVNPNGAGAGNGMSMGNVNLDFQLPFPLTIIGFSYANFGGSANLTINNVLFNTDDLINADGMNIGGTDVSIVTNVRGFATNFVTIQGNITQFSVGGQEFELDDVRYVVPAPGAAALLGVAGLGITRRRRR